MKHFNIAFHAKALYSGFLKTLGGTATAALMGLSVYGFISVPSDGGYIAVAEFIVAIMFTIIAFICMYAQGRGLSWKGRKEGKHSKK